MLLGYNTNGLAHHELFDAVALLAELGYRSVAITIDHAALPPYGRYGRQRSRRLRHLLERCRDAVGDRDRGPLPAGPATKARADAGHRPIPAGRARRIEFYRYAIDCAAELGSDCVSLWSGTLRPIATADSRRAEQAMDRLVEGLARCSSTRPSGR